MAPSASRAGEPDGASARLPVDGMGEHVKLQSSERRLILGVTRGLPTRDLGPRARRADGTDRRFRPASSNCCGSSFRLGFADGSARAPKTARREQGSTHMVARPSPTGGIHGHYQDHDDGRPSDVALRVRALESLLIEKGYVDPAALDAIVATYETKIGPRNGARVVARSWADPAYRQRLLDDATAAIRSLGYAGRQGEHMVAVENTDAVHNMVVCTLCSCYPLPVLGLPPVWYKSAPYRSRAVIDPRGVLAEFGVSLPPETKIRVWDSTAEIRYLVVPMRPAERTAGARSGWLRW